MLSLVTNLRFTHPIIHQYSLIVPVFMKYLREENLRVLVDGELKMSW